MSARIALHSIGPILKLFFFTLQLAQPIRLLLNYAGEEFEDVQYEQGDGLYHWIKTVHLPPPSPLPPSPETYNQYKQYVLMVDKQK